MVVASQFQRGSAIGFGAYGRQSSGHYVRDYLKA